MWKWDLCSGENILLLVLCCYSVSKSHLRLPLLVFLPSVVTYWHAAEFVDDVQVMFKHSIPFCKANFKAYLT